MTGRVNILLRIFEKNAKKLKMKSQERKNIVLVNLSENVQQISFRMGPVTSILNFVQFSQSKSTLPVILSFMKFFVAQLFRTQFLFNCCKVKYLSH